MLALSRRYSILPALISCTAFVTSIVTVPALGLGMRPLGPRTLPRRPTTPIISGVATTTSKSNHPSFWILGMSSSPPTKSAPAACASSSLAPLANTKTFEVLPVPCGSTIAPLTCWSACLESQPVRMCNSTVSSNLAVAVFLTTLIASAGS